MKIKSVPLMAALMGPVLTMTGFAQAEPRKEDLVKVYEAGRTAFNKGDYAKAKIAFTKVLQAKPDFDLAQIYIAQIRHAEEKWAARPRSQKIAETAVIGKVELKQVTLADALEVVRRELEKAGGGATAGPIALLIDLPAGGLEQPVNLTATNLPMTTFIETVAFAGGVRIAWHDQGISVTAPLEAAAKPEAATETAIRDMKQLAHARTIPHLKMEATPVAEAFHWLRKQADPAKGPLIVIREPLPQALINLDLRQIPLSEAIRSVAMVAGTEVSWQPWGAGIYAKPSTSVGAR